MAGIPLLSPWWSVSSPPSQSLLCPDALATAHTAPQLQVAGNDFSRASIQSTLKCPGHSTGPQADRDECTDGSSYCFQDAGLRGDLHAHEVVALQEGSTSKQLLLVCGFQVRCFSSQGC